MRQVGEEEKRTNIPVFALRFLLRAPGLQWSRVGKMKTKGPETGRIVLDVFKVRRLNHPSYKSQGMATRGILELRRQVGAEAGYGAEVSVWCHQHGMICQDVAPMHS